MRKSLLFLSLVVTLYTSCSKSDASGDSYININNRAIGASANEFLSAARYQSVQLEINYMPGYAPDAAAINNLLAFLNGLINKPGGINITQRPISPSGKTSLTIADIVALEKSNRTVFTNGPVLGVYLLYTDAAYNEANTLGIAYRNTSMAVFGKTIHDNSGGINQASLTKLETTVLDHEFGHLLGLVDLGSPMQVMHKAANSNHCTNSNCLMYYATQINVVGGILVPGPVLPLDTDCQNDLKANGGK